MPELQTAGNVQCTGHQLMPAGACGGISPVREDGPEPERFADEGALLLDQDEFLALLAVLHRGASRS